MGIGTYVSIRSELKKSGLVHLLRKLFKIWSIQICMTLLWTQIKNSVPSLQHNLKKYDPPLFSSSVPSDKYQKVP